MDFEEYVSANYKRLEGQTRELVEDAFKAGQQSKQAEIDALRSHLRTVLDDYYITDYYNPDTCRSAELLLLMPSIYTDDEVKIEIQELLK